MKTEVDNMKSFIDHVALAANNYCDQRVEIRLWACFRPLMGEAPLLYLSTKCIIVFLFASSLLQWHIRGERNNVSFLFICMYTCVCMYIHTQLYIKYKSWRLHKWTQFSNKHGIVMFENIIEMLLVPKCYTCILDLWCCHTCSPWVHKTGVAPFHR